MWFVQDVAPLVSIIWLGTKGGAFTVRLPVPVVKGLRPGTKTPILSSGISKC
jgi:hypothetical protein